MPRPRGPPKRGGANKVSGRGAYRPKAPAKPRAVKGRGFYKGFAADLGYGLGRVGNAFTGRNDLHTAGRAMGTSFSNVTGLGAYSHNLNSLVQAVPEIVNAKSKEGATIVRHKEYLCDISGSTGFAIKKTIELNPGLVASFPWASQIANAYEEWELLGCLVEFVTTSGNATGANTSLGEVMISSEYNSYNPLFTSKQQMLNQVFAVSGVPSINLIHAIECSPKQNQVARFYVRDGTSSAPVVLTDLCRTSIATQGQQQAGNILGELWITYEVALYKPRLANQVAPPTPIQKTFKINGTNSVAIDVDGRGYATPVGSFVFPSDFNPTLNPQFVNSPTTALTLKASITDLSGAFNSPTGYYWTPVFDITRDPTKKYHPTFRRDFYH